MKWCSICHSPDRYRIDLAIVRKVPYKQICAEYGFSPPTISRHVTAGHVAEDAKKCQAIEDEFAALDLQKCAREIYDIATGSAKDARAAGQYGAVGGCLGPAAKVLEILAKPDEDDDDRPGIDKAIESMKRRRENG